MTTLPRLFEAQAAARPDATALLFDGRSLTYGALNRAADHLAHRLRDLGVRPGSIVGLHAEPSFEMVLGMLAAMKAGAAYLPLEPTHPKDRLAYILDTAQPVAVLSEERLVAGLPPHAAHSVAIEFVREDVAVAPVPLPEATPQDMAYVMFTSGSTGKPKGVAIPHSAAVSLLRTVQRLVEIQPNDRLLVAHSFGFDLSVWDIWGALTAGASTVLVPSSVKAAPPAFMELLKSTHVTVLLQTPSAYQRLMNWYRQIDPVTLDLRTLMFCGEALDFSSLAPWFVRHPRTSVCNLYGPTETTVFATYRRIAADEARPGMPSLIGRGLPGWTVLVVNEEQRLAEPGETGEIIIGGAGLAIGYLNRPDLTKERFVDGSLFGLEGRFYRTGDLGRTKPDGDIDYLGRNDHQVKIRGHRIELGEIENCLSAHPAVLQAVVVARSERGTTRLIAYVVTRTDRKVTTRELRESLARGLPEYMIPAAFLFPSTLPLNVNGKLDRAALPPPPRLRPELETPYLAPESADERLIAECWSSILGIDEVGVNDDLIELGGDSFAIVQIAARVGDQCSSLSMSEAIRSRTIAEMARALRPSGEQIAPDAERMKIADDAPIALTPAQHRLNDICPIEKLEAVVLGEVLEIRQPLGREDVSEIVRFLEDRHDALRARLERVNGVWRQRFEHSASATIDWHRLSWTSTAAAFEAVSEVTREVAAQVKLSGPVFKVAVADFGADRPSFLVIVLHHQVADGHALDVLFKDLQLAWAAKKSGKPIEPLRVGTGYRAWTQRIAALEKSEQFLGELPYWRSLPWQKVTPLPRSSGPRQFFNRKLGVELSRSLMDSARRNGVRIYDALVTGVLQGLHRWTGGSVFKIELINHGRQLPDADLSGTVGDLCTHPVIALEVSAGAPVEALRAVSTQLKSIPTNGFGMAMLQRTARDQLPREIHGTCEIMFNYLGRIGMGLDPALFVPGERALGETIWIEPVRNFGASLKTHARLDDDGIAITGSYGEKSATDSFAEFWYEALRELAS